LLHNCSFEAASKQLQVFIPLATEISFWLRTYQNVARGWVLTPKCRSKCIIIEGATSKKRAKISNYLENKPLATCLGVAPAILTRFLRSLGVRTHQPVATSGRFWQPKSLFPRLRSDLEAATNLSQRQEITPYQMCTVWWVLTPSCGGNALILLELHQEQC